MNELHVQFYTKNKDGELVEKLASDGVYCFDQRATIKTETPRVYNFLKNSQFHKDVYCFRFFSGYFSKRYQRSIMFNVNQNGSLV